MLWGTAEGKVHFTEESGVAVAPKIRSLLTGKVKEDEEQFES